MFDIDSVSVPEIKQGWRCLPATGHFQCLFCPASFDEGLVYPAGSQFQTAERAVRQHVADQHQSPFEQLLKLDKRFIGLTDNQKNLLRLMREGRSSQEIARITGNAASTVRAQRFLFKEKARQAKLMLALAELLDESAAAGEQASDALATVSPVHATAAQIDERFLITAADKASVIKSYVLSQDPLVISALPVKEKRKLVLLAMIAEKFAADRRYTEKEVNEIIKPIHADYVTIRRYLIEYGYLDRTASGSAYWVKNGTAAL
jgi:hypothetical protein